MAVTAATLAGGVVLVSSPAHAAGWTCSANWDTRSFNLPKRFDKFVVQVRLERDDRARQPVVRSHR